jgi:hypothetical protein
MPEGSDPSPEANALFDAYLAHCHALLGEARAWAATVPEEVQEKLHHPTIWRSLLELMPRMPAWMAEHLNGARPAIFRNEDGSETEFIEWPFSNLFHPWLRDRALITSEQVAGFRAIERRFLAGVGALDWSGEADPAAHCLSVQGVAELIVSASGKRPTRAWKAAAEALIARAGAGVVAEDARRWLAALGPADAHRAATPDWQQIGTLRLFLAEMQAALEKRLKPGSSALQKASRNVDAPALNPAQIPKMESSRHAGNMVDQTDKARRAAQRQFGYWGRLPHVDPKTGLQKNARLPGDPRVLSEANANRARGAAWLLAMTSGAEAAVPIATAADSLAAKVYHDVGYPAPRSVVAAKACLETLAVLDGEVAVPLLHDLATRIDHPPLRNWILRTIPPEPRSI